MKSFAKHPFGDNLKNRIIRMGWAKEESFQGCSESEIKELYSAQAVEYLPPLYLSFLQTMGNGFGGYFWRGMRFEYRSLKVLKEVAVEISEYASLSLPSDVFVFLYDGGDYFCFFETKNQEENPVVYCGYCNGERVIAVEAITLTGFFEDQICIYENLLWNPLITGKGQLGNLILWLQRRVRGFLNSVFR
jgi:hypothetical protein